MQKALIGFNDVVAHSIFVAYLSALFVLNKIIPALRLSNLYSLWVNGPGCEGEHCPMQCRV